MKLKDKLKQLEQKLLIYETDNIMHLECERSKLIKLNRKHYMASGLTVTITDLSGVKKFQATLSDGLTDEFNNALDDLIVYTINLKRG